MKVTILWTYKVPKRQSIFFTSDELNAKDALQLSNDLEKTGRTKELVFQDDIGRQWTKKELTKLLKDVETEPHEVVAFFDGGFDLQSKEAGLGISIYYKKDNKNYRLRMNERINELESNNEAEYASLYYLLQQLEELGVHHQSITIRGDSQVVIMQMSGEWPCYEAELEAWMKRIELKEKQLGLRVTYEHISRKDNREADQLATQALQSIEISGHLQIEGEET
ncbi:reverse transcriptase-like protein [Bacillus sp. HMF5848]|uniref:ribonuclease H family protein n=1 Tax=Bacillus sp. HMF5848 TaxID=2495421 RepID=UPI000F77DB57|nr:ribonuclease H family protein [Bacillus sp. HMF5848]RSK27322.1 reverse transcriptase-like protein [Bacillus sp. HMF5848]